MVAATDIFATAAYGGAGWSPRTTSLRQEIGSIWGACGLANEWATLQAVLLHRPGAELEACQDPNAVQMLAPLDISRAQSQHDALAEAYRQAGVAVHYVNPTRLPPPNMMFVADLMFMTPEGAILGRPASTVRAGEERLLAQRLSELGVPILRSIRGTGTFEGADAAWLNAESVLLARGLRTNREGAAQVAAILQEMGVEVIQVDMPPGTMHLMGQLRFADRDLAIGWPGRLSQATMEALEAHGYRLALIPDEAEAIEGSALNFVTLGPRRILMPEGNPNSQAFYEELGITCHTVQIDELAKAAGGIGCLTGILQRLHGYSP
ncbi:MAG: arginine deiminase family protein [Anaerolineae bacterium]